METNELEQSLEAAKAAKTEVEKHREWLMANRRTCSDDAFLGGLDVYLEALRKYERLNAEAIKLSFGI